MTTADGWSLGVRVFSPPGTPRGVVVLGHAMMVDGRSLDRPAGEGLASFLALEGWRVHVPDLRGRGLSGPTVDDGGTWSYDDFVRFDLPALVADARSAAPGPCWVVGNSLSGHASVAAAGTGAYDEPPDGHVFFSVNTWTPALEPDGLLRIRKALGSLAFGLFGLLWGRVPARRLRIGPVDEAAEYARDLHRFWKSGWRSRDGVDYLASLPSVRSPVIAFLGKADTYLAAPVAAEAWTRRLGGKVEVHHVGRGDLGLTFDPDHMTLVTDPRSRPAWREAARFMAENGAGPPLQVDAGTSAM